MGGEIRSSDAASRNDDLCSRCHASSDIHYTSPQNVLDPLSASSAHVALNPFAAQPQTTSAPDEEPPLDWFAFAPPPMSRPWLDANPVPSPEIEADDPAAKGEWEKAKQAFLDSLADNDPKGSMEAFSRMVANAMALSRVDSFEKGLADAEEHQEQDERAAATAVYPIVEERRMRSIRACHEGGWDEVSGPIEITPYVHKLEMHASAAKREVAKWRAAKERLLDRFEQLVRDAYAASIPALSPDDVTLPPVALSAMARAMIMLGEAKRAKGYYDRASFSAGTVAQSAWYKLEGLRVEAMADPEAAAEAIKTIKTIREGLAQLYVDAVIDHTEKEIPDHDEDGLAVSEVEGRIVRYEPGRPEDVQALDAFSWGVLYDVVHASLANPDLESKVVDERLALLKRLEKERRQLVKSRIGEADAYEAQLHLSNMQMVAAAWTQKGGIIENEQRTNGAEDGKEMHDTLAAGVDDIRRVVEPYMVREPGDRIFEKMANVEWLVTLEGMRSRDLPADGLRAVARDVMPLYGRSSSIKARLASLKEEAEAAGIGSRLFNPDDTLNPDIDVSMLPAGESAGERTRNAYWTSSSTAREFGLPMAGGAGCGTLALYLLENPWLAALAGGTCALAGGFGNKEYNEHLFAAEQYRQSRMTGLSRVSEEEARRYRKGWYWNQGFTGIVGSSMPVFGVAGVTAGRGLAGGTRLFIRSLADGLEESGVVGLVKNGAAATVKGLKAVDKGFWHLPAGDKVRLAVGLGYPVDYFFIDKDYDFVWGDGRVDTAIGFIGEAALMSELACRGFAFTWREGAKEFAAKGGGTRLLKGFGTQLKENPWRAWVVRGGADATIADYYLVKKGDDGLAFVDFDAPRGTLEQKRDFERQFGIDTPIGKGGLVAMFGDWAVTEFRSFPIYMQSARQVAMSQGRIIAGASLVAGDLVEDGEFDRWYLGGVGGGFLMNEAGAIMLEVDAWGSMVATGFRIGWEWLGQWQQEQPFASPDPMRITWASFDSTIMRFPSKWFVMGERYLRGFPAGRRIVAAQKWMTADERPGFVRTIGSSLRSIEGLAGKPALMPDEKGWKVVPVKADSTKPIKLTYGADGKELNEPIVLKVHRQGKSPKDGAGAGEPRRLATLSFDGKVHNGPLSEELTELLKKNSFFVRDGVLYQVVPQYIGQVTLGVTKRVLKSDDLKRMSDDERGPVINELRKQGIYWDKEKNQLWKRWIKTPAQGTVLSSGGKYTDGPISTDDVKVVGVPLGENGTRVWIAFKRERKVLEEATIGGRPHTIFYGDLRNPRMRWGVPIQGVAMMGTAWVVNDQILQRAMEGDPVYQSMQRTWQYFISEFFVHPWVMWPMGFDTPKAQFIGRLIGTATFMTGIELFPTYNNTWPGLYTYYDRADGVPPDVASVIMDHIASPFHGGRVRTDTLDTFVNTMSSTQISPIGKWGKAEGSNAYFEPRAFNTFIHTEDCVRQMLTEGTDLESSACRELPVRTLKDLKKATVSWNNLMKERSQQSIEFLKQRVEKLASDFERWMERERERDLSEMERRGLILMAAKIRQTLATIDLVGDSAPQKAYAPWYALRDKYEKVLFNKIPPLPGDAEWTSYVGDVNAGRAAACDFHYYLEKK